MKSVKSHAVIKYFNFLRPILNFYIIGLSALTLSRMLLVLFFYDRVVKTENFGWVFLIGIRFDLIMLSYLAVIPAALILLLPFRLLNKIQGLIRIYFVSFLALFFCMELVTPNFLMEYDTRPNRLFIEYLVYPREVFNMLIKSVPWQLASASLVLVGSVWFLWKQSKKLFQLQKTIYLKKILLFPLIGFLLVFGARSSLTSIRPINISNSVFSSSQFTNSLALNSLYTLSFALYSMKDEEDMTKMYGSLDDETALQNVRKYMNVRLEDFTDQDIPLLHKQYSVAERLRPYNLVIFLQESMGSQYVGHLGGLPLTPNLDSLAKEGLVFTNLYCTGTRSVRGIEAVVSGFLPTASRSVVKLGKAQNGFFTLANLLKNEGFKTSFIYGGMANFDNMAGFFNGNGFDNIVDETDYNQTRSAFKGVWGYSDEDLARKANDLFTSYGDKPFFSLMFSTSNHDPFEFPDGRITLYEQPKNTVNNAIKYADFAIGRFFEMAKKEKYYENTIFIIVADHNTRVYGNHLFPIHKFHIPAVILGPNVSPGVYDKLCSQIDLAPTLLDMIGLNTETPMPGRDLLQLPDSIPGRAIMQFHAINAFRKGNDVVIMQPKSKSVQFELLNDTTYIERPLDRQLEEDALSHIVMASKMYNERTYKIKPRN